MAASGSHFNQSVLLEVPSDVSSDGLGPAMTAIVDHHDALRARFTFEGGIWSARLAAAEEHPLTSVLDLAGLAVAEQDWRVGEAAEAAQRSLDLHHGPLVRAVLFELGPHRPRQVLVVAHHLVIDAVSWRIVVEDLHIAWASASRDEPLRLGAKSSSYRQWAHRLAELAESGHLEGEVAYWTDRARSTAAVVPRDVAAGDNSAAAARSVVVGLDADTTAALLGPASRAYRTQINDLLLAALAMTLTRWCGGAVLVDVEGHGREDVGADLDVSRTVGWFTTIFPVLVSSPPGDEVGAVIKAVKEGLRAVPRHGLG
jgi:hypothetical protein